MEKLNDFTDQRKKELKEKEFEIEELVKKVNLLKPKLEACLKDTQSKDSRIQILEDEVSELNFYKEKNIKLDEKWLDLKLLEEETHWLRKTKI